MMQMEFLDSLSIAVLAENSVLQGTKFLGQHGISFYVVASKNGLSKHILIDTAQNAKAVLHNMKLMGIQASSIDAIILTHCHYDHTDGLADMLKNIDKRDLPVIAHPDLFRETFVEKPFFRSIGMNSQHSKAALEELGAHWFLTAEPLQVLPGLTTTGYIARSNDFEDPGIVSKTIDHDSRVIPDPMRDDISVIAATKDKGLIILTGCSHAGIVNIVNHAIAITGLQKVQMLIGGLHLVDASQERIEKTVDMLDSLICGSVYAGHCTGFDAEIALRSRFKDRFLPLQTGMRFEIA